MRKTVQLALGTNALEISRFPQEQTSMVRKGSPVRVRQRASQNRALARFSYFRSGFGDHFRAERKWSRLEAAGLLVLAPVRLSRAVVRPPDQPGTRWAPLRMWRGTNPASGALLDVVEVRPGDDSRRGQPPPARGPRIMAPLLFGSTESFEGA